MADTPTKVSEKERKFQEAYARIVKARSAIVENAGKYVKGVHVAGCVTCPVCGVADALRYSRAGINGHIHARCNTANCVSWME